MRTQARSRSLSKGISPIRNIRTLLSTRRREAAAGLLLLIASAAFASRDHGVSGPSIFDLRQAGEQVRLVVSTPVPVQWKAKIETVHCVSKRAIAPVAWIDGNGSTIKIKPAALDLCASVDTIHVKNVGAATVASLWAERVASGVPVAASVSFPLNPGETARIAHTGEVGIYIDGRDHPIRDHRR